MFGFMFIYLYEKHYSKIYEAHQQSRYFASQALSRICEATGLEGWNLIGADGAQAGVAGVSDTTVCHLLPLVVPSKLPSSSPSFATVATVFDGTSSVKGGVGTPPPLVMMVIMVLVAKPEF